MNLKRCHVPFDTFVTLKDELGLAIVDGHIQVRVNILCILSPLLLYIDDLVGTTQRRGSGNVFY